MATEREKEQARREVKKIQEQVFSGRGTDWEQEQKKAQAKARWKRDILVLIGIGVLIYLIDMTGIKF